MSRDIRHQVVALLPRLRAFGRALARSNDAADDLVQATCEKALRSLDTWTPGTRLDSWMFRIMQNQWIDLKRRERPQVHLDDPDTGVELTGEDGERTVEFRLTLNDVRRLIDTLPEEQRVVLMLVCVDDMSYREVAELVGTPLGTVMSRLGRARRALSDALEGKSENSRAAGGRP
jgi:RNA polymerase sigma-70 factor (ECF subfamily)